MPARTPKDAELAKVQLAVTEQEAQLPADERAEDREETEERPAGIYVPLSSKLGPNATGKTREFRLGDEVTFMSLMEWAAAADEGNGPGNLMAYFHVLKDIVHDDEFAEFRKFGRENRCVFEDYQGFQQAAFEALSGNPTE